MGGCGVFAFLAPAGTVAVVGTAFAGGRHIGNGCQNRVLAALGNILFGANGCIKDLPQSNNTDRQSKTEQKTNNRVNEIAGRTGLGRNNRCIYDFSGSAVDDGTDPLRQDIRDGICEPLCFLRIRAGNRYLENLRFVDRLRNDHVPQVLVVIGYAGIVHHIVQCFTGFQDYKIGINQISGCGQVARGNT